MPLNKKEIEEAEKMLKENPRMSARKIIDHFSEKPFTRAKEGVNKIFKEKPKNFNKTREREQKQGFKILTQGESSKGDKSSV